MEPPVAGGQKSSLRHMLVAGKEKGHEKEVTQGRRSGGLDSEFAALGLKPSEGTPQLSGKQRATPLDLLSSFLPSRNFSLACKNLNPGSLLLQSKMGPRGSDSLRDAATCQEEMTAEEWMYGKEKGRCRHGGRAPGQAIDKT